MAKNLLLFSTLALLYCSTHCSRDQENGHCSRDGCTDELEEAGGRSAQRWNTFSALLYCSTHCSRDQDNGYCSRDGCADELEKAGSRSAQRVWSIFSSISNTLLTSVKDTIKYNAYKTYNKTAEFAGNIREAVEDFSERVRTVFREEFSSFLEVLWERAVGTKPENDSLFLKFRDVIIDRALALGLIIFCLLLDYFILYFSYSAFTAIIYIFIFNSSVILVYKLLGPLWVYWLFWKAVGYVWYTVSFIWSYPYISSGLICGLFVFTTLNSIYHWRRDVERREWNENMIKSIAIRLERIEEQNEEMKCNIQTLLKRSSANNSI